MAVVVVRQTVGVCVGQRERERERAARDGAAERSGANVSSTKASRVSKRMRSTASTSSGMPRMRNASCSLLAAVRAGRGCSPEGAAGEIDRQPLVVLDDAGVVFREGERRQVDARAVRRTQLRRRGFRAAWRRSFRWSPDAMSDTTSSIGSMTMASMVSADAVGTLVGEVALRVGYQPSVCSVSRSEPTVSSSISPSGRTMPFCPSVIFFVDFVEVVGAVDASAAQCAEYARQENRVVLLHVDWVQIVFYSGAKIV